MENISARTSSMPVIISDPRGQGCALSRLFSILPGLSSEGGLRLMNTQFLEFEELMVAKAVGPALHHPDIVANPFLAAQ